MPTALLATLGAESGLEALSDNESSAAVAIAKKLSFSTGECLLSARQGRIG